MERAALQSWKIGSSGFHEYQNLLSSAQEWVFIYKAFNRVFFFLNLSCYLCRLRHLGLSQSTERSMRGLKGRYCNKYIEIVVSSQKDLEVFPRLQSRQQSLLHGTNNIRTHIALVLIRVTASHVLCWCDGLSPSACVLTALRCNQQTIFLASQAMSWILYLRRFSLLSQTI